MEERKEEINKFSPKNISHKIGNKIFIMHGANDSMVPFTESTYLHDNLKDSTLLVSFLCLSYSYLIISQNNCQLPFSPIWALSLVAWRLKLVA